MKLKKLISVMLIGACVCSMAACGSKKEEKKIENTPKKTQKKSNNNGI